MKRDICFELEGSQWKVRQYDQHFPIEEKPLLNKYEEERKKSKRVGLSVTSRHPRNKVNNLN